jgi:hypothetical protein
MSEKSISRAQELISKIRSEEDPAKAPAWQSAGPLGVGAVRPLLELYRDPSFEVVRKARRALQSLVRYAGRPGAGKEASALQKELITSLKVADAQARRDIVWLLSELPGTAAVKALAPLLSDPAAREDARCALTRIPGAEATSALKSSLAKAPPEFQAALADSLRARGEPVTGHPSKKLVASAQTAVKPPKGKSE